jgi:hypothetical protein
MKDEEVWNSHFSDLYVCLFPTGLKKVKAEGKNVTLKLWRARKALKQEPFMRRLFRRNAGEGAKIEFIMNQSESQR